MSQPPALHPSFLDRWQRPPEPVGDSHWGFPDSLDWADGDLVARGADLEPATLIGAYRRGLFPMRVHAGNRTPRWWSPEHRGVLPLDGLRVTKSMKQSAKKYEVRIDTCFDEVVRACGNPAREHGWIDEEIVRVYTTLHELGWAHSVEAFDREGRLSGGLYGVRVGAFFAGESMFHVGRDASKVALMGLVRVMRETDMALLDVQWRTDFLASLGVVEVTRQEYLVLLRAALA